MHYFDILTILCVGLMIGNEFAVSVFVNPVVWQLEGHAQAKALSRGPPMENQRRANSKVVRKLLFRESAG